MILGIALGMINVCRAGRSCLSTLAATEASTHGRRAKSGSGSWSMAAATRLECASHEPCTGELTTSAGRPRMGNIGQNKPAE
jgi:hypothetical protein